MTTLEIEEGIYVNDTLTETTKDIDSVIFDCDGVLIDVSNSYDVTIQRTTEYILKEIANLEKFDPVTSKMIDSFKATGGFNDEVDLTYAAILSLVAADLLKKRGNEFVFEVIENADKSGIISVEKFLESLNVDISKIKKILNYPGRHSENILYSTFDQMFYGPELYQKLFKKKSNFTDEGLIDNDIVLVKHGMLKKLKKKFDNKVAIVTGRGKDSISYSMKELMEQFDLKNSVFLEDESRELAKPNPSSLIRSIKGMNSSHCLYVGDSMEDFIMAEEATMNGHKTIFCGIFGTSKFPEQKIKLFKENNANLFLKSINLLPKALNLV